MHQNYHIATITSYKGGLAHYNCHLYPHLPRRYKIIYLTYKKSLSDSPDDLFEKSLPNVHYTIDPTNPDTIIDCTNILISQDINILNVHIGTTVRKNIHYFSNLVKSALLHQIKIVYTIHDVIPFEKNNVKFEEYLHFYQMADFIIVGNRMEKSLFQKHFKGFPINHIKTIQLGIFNLFNQQRLNQRTARQRLLLPQSRKIALFFGYLKPHKGLCTLIEAFNLLKNSGIDLFLCITSSIDYTNIKLINNYKNLICKLNLNQEIQMKLQYLPTPEIELFFQATDLVILPYSQVSQSGVLMTAFAFKKPVIVSSIFSESTWINHKAGLVFKVGDPADLAEKIINLLNNPCPSLDQMGKYGYAYALKHRNWKDVGNQYSQIFNQLLNSKN